MPRPPNALTSRGRKLAAIVGLATVKTRFRSGPPLWVFWGMRAPAAPPYYARLPALLKAGEEEAKGAGPSEEGNEANAALRGM